MEYQAPPMTFYQPPNKRKTPNAQAMVAFAAQAKLQMEHRQHNAAVDAKRAAKAALKMK